MNGATVRISPGTRDLLRELAREEQSSMQAVLEQAVEHYRRERFLHRANMAFAALREDPAAWREEMREREEWDATLADGEEEN